VLLFEAASLEEVRTLAQSLPLAQQGMLRQTFLEVGPYRGFGPRG
jgi:hypothetical protein